MLLSFWVNFPPFIYLAPLKSVPCLINPALMGSFSDPTFTLQVSLLDIQGPYSYLVTTGAGIFFFVQGSQRSPGQARASSPCWEALGTPGHCAPATPPASVDQDSPLYSLWDKAPATIRGMGILQGSGGVCVRSASPRERGGGGGGVPGVQLKTSRD